MDLAPDETLLEQLGALMPGQGQAGARPSAGGDIASSWHLRRAGGEAFLKLMPAGSGVLAAEAEGLAELEQAAAVRVPGVLGMGEDRGRDWLLLEFLPLAPLSGPGWGALGEALAHQHSVGADAHGWHRDNFIGTTPQPNPREPDWRVFYRRARLGHQLELARERGLDRTTVDRVEAVMAVVEALVPHQPAPALLHGDLWSGNVAAVEERPVIFDPAVYYGDADADLAMLELFGAPPAAFRDAYTGLRPLEPGYEVRRSLYNLYHLLNHFNLFGGGFAGQASRVCERLLAEVRA